MVTVDCGTMVTVVLWLQYIVLWLWCSGDISHNSCYGNKNVI